MSVDLKSLIELQNLDREIAKLERSKMEFPKKVTEMEATLLEKKGILTAAEGKLETLTKDINKSLTALEDNKAALETSHDRLNLVKTNREYDAILLEISERKEMIDKDRKKQQKFKTRNEALDLEISAAKEVYESAAAELQPQIDELTSKIGSIDEDIEKVVISRKDSEPKVPEAFLSEYNRIREKRKNGIALSVVSESSRACGYCYQVLNARAQKAAHSIKDPIYCENCGSIIVWDHNAPEPEEVSKK